MNFTHKLKWKNVFILFLLFGFVEAMVFYDYLRVEKDAKALKNFLSGVRLRALQENQSLGVKFQEKSLELIDYATKGKYDDLRIPTLSKVNYDTTEGKDMIIFTTLGTSPYNTRIHGGDLELRSWFGFKKNIAVNCTGFVSFGTYPEE